MMALLYYIIKVMACSGCLYLYYQLALKNKVFHHWNRFYLLFGTLLSLFLPFIQIIIFQHSAETGKAIQLLQAVQSADNYLEEFTISNATSLSPATWICIGYVSISTMLVSLLLRSIWNIFSIIRRHPVHLLQQVRFINTEEPGTPFSFFNFIFWNQSISLQTETGQQIFRHERCMYKRNIRWISFLCKPF